MDTDYKKNDFGLATEEYESEVVRRADGDLALEIDNFHIAHAAILTRHIFRLTQNSVDIVTGSMQEFFFKKIESDFKKVLDRKVAVRIIFVNKGAACPDLLRLEKQYPNLSIYEIGDDFRSDVKSRVCHFCVSDNKRFRIEEIHPDKDFVADPSVRAKASFNRPDVAKLLHGSFNDLLNLSDSVKVNQAVTAVA